MHFHNVQKKIKKFTIVVKLAAQRVKSDVCEVDLWKNLNLRLINENLALRTLSCAINYHKTAD